MTEAIICSRCDEPIRALYVIGNATNELELRVFVSEAELRQAFGDALSDPAVWLLCAPCVDVVAEATAGPKVLIGSGPTGTASEEE